MTYIVHEDLIEKIPSAYISTVTDLQEVPWQTGWKEMLELRPWWVELGRNHRVDGCVLSREVDQQVYLCEVSNLESIIDELKIDIAIVNTCLTHEGKKLKMIMPANDYQEYY